MSISESTLRPIERRNEIERRLAKTAALVGGLLQVRGQTPDRSPEIAHRVAKLERINRRLADARRRNLGIGRFESFDGRRHLLPYTEEEIQRASRADIESIRAGYRFKQEVCNDAGHEARRGES